MFLNGCQACLNLCSPFIIKPLIEYVKTGENAWSPTIEFWDTSDVEYLKWLTPQTQYGLSLAFMLVFTQGFGYILAETINFK